MMNLKHAIQFFGCSLQNPELDAYLLSIGITERPEFEENPTEDISREQDGYALSFRTKHGYEKNWGEPRDDLGTMIFYAVQFYGAKNDSGFNEYKGDPPYNLSFNSTLENAKQVLGEPFTNHPSGPENEVFIWYNLSGLTIGICFLPDQKGISFISIEKAKKNAPEKIDWL